MGAMALALGIRLSKPGVYVLNPDGRTATAADLAGALHRAGVGLARGVCGLLLLALAAGGLR